MSGSGTTKKASPPTLGPNKGVKVAKSSSSSSSVRIESVSTTRTSRVHRASIPSRIPKSSGTGDKTVLVLYTPTRPDWFQRDPAMSTRMDLIEEVRSGVKWVDFKSCISHIGITMKEAAIALDLPERTLARRKDGRLETQESDRFSRLLRVWNLAVDVLGEEDKARSWLQTPNRVLGAPPLSLLDTDMGTQAVEDVLGRIEYGVFS